MIKIGVTGTAGAGKTTFVRYLASKGFEHISLSDLIRNELALRDMELTRVNLQDVGNQMREKHGLGIWAKKAIEIMHPDRNYVIDSIRNPGEIKTLSDSGDFVLFSIEAPLETRFARVSLRPEMDGRERVTLIDFIKSEARETDSDESSNQQLRKCAKMAQANIANDADMASFFAKIDKELAAYSGKARHFEI